MHGFSSLLLARRMPVGKSQEDLEALIEQHIFKGVGRTLGLFGI